MTGSSDPNLSPWLAPDDRPAPPPVVTVPPPQALAATAIQCSGSGVSQRCVGDFTSDTGIIVERVALLGVEQSDLAPQKPLSARMVAATSDQAYVGAALRGLHLRWVVGLLLALLCGVGIALTTGAIRFRDRRTRRAAFATSLAAPLLPLIGFLAAAF